MSRIQPIELDHAQGKAAELLGAVQKMLGGAPNMFRTAAQAPAALEAMVGMFVATSHGALRPKVREAIALTVAELNGCDYCLSAHSALGKGAGLSQEEQDLARAGSSRDPKTNAILQLAKALVVARGRVGEGALDAARSAGVSDAEALEVVANVALNVFTNYFNLLAGTDIDFPVVRAATAAAQAA